MVWGLGGSPTLAILNRARRTGGSQGGRDLGGLPGTGDPSRLCYQLGADEYQHLSTISVEQLMNVLIAAPPSESWTFRGGRGRERAWQK